MILAHAKQGFREALRDYVGDEDLNGYDESVDESFPASDAPSHARRQRSTASRTSTARTCRPTSAGRPSRRRSRWPTAPTFEIDHGAVTIAAITSCTNTSNPSVMIGAALVAKKAVERGLTRKPWVKTTLAPGSKVVTDYYDRSGLTPYLDKLGLQPGRLRLHHLHRQLRPADPRGQRRRSTRTTSPWSRCSPATATSRAGSTPTSR